MVSLFSDGCGCTRGWNLNSHPHIAGVGPSTGRISNPHPWGLKSADTGGIAIPIHEYVSRLIYHH